MFNLFVNSLGVLLNAKILLYAHMTLKYSTKSSLWMTVEIYKINSIFFVSGRKNRIYLLILINAMLFPFIDLTLFSFFYTLNEIPLLRVPTIKNLWIHYLTNSCFSYHIDIIVSSAIKILGFVKRNIQLFTLSVVFSNEVQSCHLTSLSIKRLND